MGREFSGSARDLNQHHSQLIAGLQFEGCRPLPEGSHFDDTFPTPSPAKGNPPQSSSSNVPYLSKQQATYLKP